MNTKETLQKLLRDLAELNVNKRAHIQIEQTIQSYINNVEAQNVKEDEH